jgi:alkanesulfonate monooxygenase SsuD/methylene tetrahydromethanopterin reductase-like flavin-dependent oxidoreductase (luciferase family)
MQYGFIFPGGDAQTLAELAHEAEAAGWDGVFVPDCIDIDNGNRALPAGFDPWVTLAAIAMRTERVRLGAIVTPPSRRRPWKLARETMTLDHLSNGRLIVAVGLGALDDGAFGKVGCRTSTRITAELPHERRHFEPVFASPIMSPDAGSLPREGRKGECCDEFPGQT